MVRVRTPYVSELLHPSLAVVCKGFDYKQYQVLGETGYTRYLQERWNEAKSFINIEHDIVVTPNQIQELWNCKEHWCVCTYKGYDTKAPMFGCTKLSQACMIYLPYVWDKQYDSREFSDAPMWSWCDSWFYRYAQENGRGRIEPHYHGPVINDKRIPC